MSALPFPLLPVLFITGIFYLNFASRIVLAPLLPIVEPELGLGHGAAGTLFLLQQAGYAVGLLLSGFLSWKLTHRRTITASSVAVGAAMVAISLSGSVAGMQLGLLLLGAAAGLYLPSGIATLTGLASESHWGKAMAIHELAPIVGYITAPLLAEAALRVLPWRGVLAGLGLLAMFLGTLFAFYGRGGGGRGEPPRHATMLRLVRDPALWMMAALFAVSIGAGLGLYTMMPLFLVSGLGMERGWANTLSGLSRVSGLGIIFLSGLLGDRIGHRRALVAFQTLTGTLTLLLGLAPGPLVTSVLVFLQAGAAVCFFPAAFSLLSLSFPSHLRSLAVSLVTLVGTVLGAGLVPSAVGHLAEVASFSLAFSLVGLLTLASALMLRLASPRDAATR